MSSVQLGPFQIDHPFLLAPMAGITNSPFRRLMRQMKSSVVISELVSANGLEYASDRTKRMLDFHEDERIVGLQIFSERTELLVKGCQYVERLGADFVDLNLGCPVKKIVSKGAGAALCRDPVRLGMILEQMVRSVSIPVTIKIRLGWDHQSINADEVVKVAADSGVAWVAVHGRTRSQGYSGASDWEKIAEVKSRATIPIIGNGDVVTAEQALEYYRRYEVDAVMIGRGALRNPFIFEQCQALWEGKAYGEVGPADFLGVMRRQRVFLTEVFDERMALLQVRKFLSWYSSGFPGCHDFRKKVFSIPEPSKLWSEAEEFFGSLEKRDQSFLRGPFLMGGHG